MNSGAIIAVAALVACGASFAIVKVTSDGRSAAPQAAPDAATANRLAELAEQQRQLTASLRELRDRCERLEAQRAPIVDSAAPSADDVRRIVAEVLAGSGEAAAPAAARGADAKKPPIHYEEAMAQIGDPTMDWDDKQIVWARVHEAGLTDEVVAAIEAHAKANPNDAGAQTDKGAAYLQKMFTIKSDMEKGLWAQKADVAFGEALDIDPKRWDARFLKATSLSFWPPVLGRQSEAVKNFEVLVEQQESAGGKRPEYAETYLYLGNLYDQQGKHDQARATWQKGLDRFPAHAQLREKIK